MKPIHMYDALGIANDAFPLLQPTQLVGLHIRNDLEDLPFPDYLDRDTRFECLIENVVEVFPELGSGDSHLLLSQLHQRLRRQHGFRIFRRELFGLGRMIHRAKLGTAHRAKGGILEAFLRQRFVMHGFSRLGVE